MTVGHFRYDFGQHAHILQEQRVHPHFIQLLYQSHRVLQFSIIDDGVYRHVDTCAELVRIAAQLTNVFHRIACRRPGAKLTGADIYGIGTMVDGSHATFQILGWSQQFEKTHWKR